jgi:hypothetical protein
MSTTALQRELLLVKQQLAEAKLIQDKSNSANKHADDAQARLLEQMEKNYVVAQRVNVEKSKRQESDFFIKGLRDQMREATARALSVASELEREKTKNSDLRIKLARCQKNNQMERLPNVSEDDYDDESEGEEERIESVDEEEEENVDENADENADANNPATASKAHREIGEIGGGSRSKPKRRRKIKRGKKKKRKTRTTTTTTTTTTSSENGEEQGVGTKQTKQRRRPLTSGSSSAPTSNQLKLARTHSTDLFDRLADAKRATKVAKAESAAKSKQLHALSNHLEKMMALLRAEAAAKASGEEALRSTEDELALVRQEKLALTAQVGALRMSSKDEMSRDNMLAKQLVSCFGSFCFCFFLLLSLLTTISHSLTGRNSWTKSMQR